MAFRVEHDYVAPAVISYTTEELKTRSLRELYVASCARYGVQKINAVVLESLPHAPTGHHYVHTIDLRGTYVGRRGLVSLLPILQACPRLRILDLSGTGLSTSVAEALLGVLETKSRLHSLSLSNNDLGTPIADALLRFVKTHRNLRELYIEHCLFIAPLKRKIQAEVAHNTTLPEVVHPLEEIEQCRGSTEAAAIEPSVNVLVDSKSPTPLREPTWLPLVDDDVRDAIYRHRHHLRDFISLFIESGTGGDVGLVSEAEFERVMRVSNIASLAGAAPREQNRIAIYTGRLKAFHPATRQVRYLDFLHAVRPHANDANNRVIDALYDMKPMLLDAFQMLDVDNRGIVSYDEVVAGVKSLRQLSDIVTEEEVREALALCGVQAGPAGVEGVSGPVKYRVLLDGIQLKE